MTTKSCLRANAAIFSASARVRIPAVGLLGVTSRSALVLGVISGSIAAARTSKASCGWVGTETATAPQCSIAWS